MKKSRALSNLLVIIVIAVVFRLIYSSLPQKKEMVDTSRFQGDWYLNHEVTSYHIGEVSDENVEWSRTKDYTLETSIEMYSFKNDAILHYLYSSYSQKPKITMLLNIYNSNGEIWGESRRFNYELNNFSTFIYGPYRYGRFYREDEYLVVEQISQHRSSFREHVEGERYYRTVSYFLPSDIPLEWWKELSP